MSDNPRIDDLRRRVQKDPASIAFAQLAEEFRRAGQFQEAVDVCHAGLEIHPTYLSARVTLGRAFIELNKLDEAQSELEQVLKGARENLAAIRGLAEIHHRRGELGEALTQYRAALALARNDPELEFTVSELAKQVDPAKPAKPGESAKSAESVKPVELAMPVESAKPIEPAKPAPPAAGLSLEPAQREPPAHAPIAEPETFVLEADPFVLETDPFIVEEDQFVLTIAEPAPVALHPAPPPPFISFAPAPPIAQPVASLAAPAAAAPVTPRAAPLALVPTVDPLLSFPSQAESTEVDSTRARAARTIVALELWLGAIHVARADQRA